MAVVTFAARVKSDGTLTMPKEAAENLGILPGDSVQVRVESANKFEAGALQTPLSKARHEMAHRTQEQIANVQARAMELYRPIRTVPPGKTLADVVSGKWPGDETDEEIETALRDLS